MIGQSIYVPGSQGHHFEVPPKPVTGSKTGELVNSYRGMISNLNASYVTASVKPLSTK